MMMMMMMMMNILILISSLAIFVTAEEANNLLSKRADSQEGRAEIASQQLIGNRRYEIDLNKSPPRETNETASHLRSEQEREKMKFTNKNDSITKKKKGRKKIYTSKEEKENAIKRSRKKYRDKFTLAEIEKTKMNLKGEELNNFLAKADRYHSNVKLRTSRARARKAGDSSQNVKFTITPRGGYIFASRALQFHEKMKQNPQDQPQTSL